MTRAVRYLLVPTSIVAVAIVAAFAGCGGAACFRNSDCNSGYGCKSGSCQLLLPPSTDVGDAGDDAAESAAAVAPDAGDDDASQNADAG